MLEKRILIINNEKYEREPGWSNKIEEALKKTDKVTCTISHYSHISYQFIEKIKPQYIILTGRIGHHWKENEISEKYIPKLNIIKELDIPILGICAGIQLIVIMYGGNIGKIVAGKDDILEEGYTKLFIKKEHELLQGLNEDFYCYQSHRDEVKMLPGQFELLASSDMCNVQMVAHKERLMFGVQFHPEWFNDDYPDGQKILKNFLNITN